MKYSQISSTQQFIGCILLVFIVIEGCTTATIQENREKSLNRASEQKIVVVPLGSRADDIAACVQKNVQRACPALQFFSSDEFVNMLYPWFEPGTAPETKEDLRALFKNRLVQEKIDTLGVRYVVNISGGTLKYNYSESEFEIPGTFLYLEKSHEERTDIWVSVCDLKKAKMLLKTGIHDHDTQHLFLVGFLPIWMPADNTEAQVCEEIVNRLTLQLRICDLILDKERK